MDESPDLKNSILHVKLKIVQIPFDCFRFRCLWNSLPRQIISAKNWQTLNVLVWAILWRAAKRTLKNCNHNVWKLIAISSVKNIDIFCFVFDLCLLMFTLIEF